MSEGSGAHDAERFEKLVQQMYREFFRHRSVLGKSEGVHWSYMLCMRAAVLMLADPKLDWSGELLTWVMDERAAEISPAQSVDGRTGR